MYSMHHNFTQSQAGEAVGLSNILKQTAPDEKGRAAALRGDQRARGLARPALDARALVARFDPGSRWSNQPRS